MICLYLEKMMKLEFYVIMMVGFVSVIVDVFGFFVVYGVS